MGKGKTVLLDFFYVNCVPCQTYTPGIVQIHNDYDTSAGKLTVWGISDRDNNQAISQFDQNLGVNYSSCGTDGGGDTITGLYMSWFSFLAWPTYAVICPDKSIAWNLPKSAGFTEIRAAIDDCPDLTGIIKYGSNSEFKVYPTPANQQFFIKSNGPEPSEIHLIELLSGKEVLFLRKILSAEPEKILITELPAGMYLLIIRSNNGEAIFKIPIIR